MTRKAALRIMQTLRVVGMFAMLLLVAVLPYSVSIGFGGLNPQTSNEKLALPGYSTGSAPPTVWNKTYGYRYGEIGDWAFSVVQTSDGGYALAGYTDLGTTWQSDFWLVKTDAFGNMQWNKTYGGPNNDEAHSLVQTSDQGYAIAGNTYMNYLAE